MVTLALNIAEPLIEGDFGRAAFDAVGPLLLIGWAEVGPSLLQAMRTGETTPSRSEGSLEPYTAERSAPHGFR